MGSIKWPLITGLLGLPLHAVDGPAAEIYARRQRPSDVIIHHAHTIKVDALTLMGEFLKEIVKNHGAKGNPGGQGAKLVRYPEDTAQAPTLASVGIGKKESLFAQALATLSVAEPELREQVRNAEMSAKAAIRPVSPRSRNM